MFKNASQGILGFFTTILWIGAYIGGIALHLFTVYTILMWKGVLEAVLAFFFPVLSEIYLMYASFKIAGIFLTVYNATVLGYFLIVIIKLGFTKLFCDSMETIKQ